LLAIVARRVSLSNSTPDANERLTKLDDAALAVAQSIDESDARPLLRSTVDFFVGIRDVELRKYPSTAELIDWVRYLLRAGAKAGNNLAEIPQLVHESLGVLVKSFEDLEAIKPVATAKIPLTRT
jgi:hypothetical protein